MFRRGAKLDNAQVRDRRGKGGLAVAGGGVGILVLLISAFLGVDVTGVIDPGASSGGGGVPIQNCQTGADANAQQDCAIVGYVNSIQTFWQDEFATRNTDYSLSPTVLFSGVTQTACGTASS